MNEVQEYILKRAMQKVANAEEQKKLKDLPNTMPEDYYKNREEAYNSRPISAHNVYPRRTVLDILSYQGFRPSEASKADINVIRKAGAEEYLKAMGLQPGSAKWVEGLKFLMNHGRINQYNELNPYEPMDIPKVNTEIFNEKEQKQLQEGGPTISSNNNYKKFSGNV